MGIPLKITAKDLSDYLAVMSKAVFQAGLSWKAIDSRWVDFEEAFEKFVPEKVSRFNEEKIEKLLDNGKLLKTEGKIRATIKNAGTLIHLDTKYDGFKKYLKSFPSYEHLAKDLCKNFAQVGPLSAYYFLFRVGEPVPEFTGWVKTIKGDHPRMKEMVELAQSKAPTDKQGDALNRLRS